MSQASKKKHEPPGLTSMIISVVYVATGQLIEYERNPRRNDAVVGRMVESIREFGFVIPTLATRDGVLLMQTNRIACEANPAAGDLWILGKTSTLRRCLKPNEENLDK